MKRIYSSFITVLLLTFICNAQENTIFRNGKAIICGHSDMHSNELQTIAVDISGVIEMKGQNYIDFISSENGNFKFNIDISNAKDITLKFSNKILTLFVSPGDSMFIRFDRLFETCAQSDIVNRVTYFGSHAEINKTILEYHAFKGDSSFIPDCNGKTVEKYKAELAQWINNRENKISQFTKFKNPSKGFVDWAKFDNIYSNANYLVDFMVYLSMNKSHLEGNLFDSSIFPVNNDNALISSQYRFHLNQYLIFKYLMNPSVQSLISKKDYYSGYRKALNLILANESAGVSRDILVNDLFSLCILDDQSSYQRLQKEFPLSISNIHIRSESEKHWNTVIKQPKSIEFISSSNSRDSIIGDLFKEIETRFKDKVIYIDIWSTWCSPCMHEFPYSQKLRDLYKGKNIEFVYICLNSSKENWQRTRTRLNLGGTHFYLNQMQSDIFSNKFQTHGFPTYYLIDKKGQLVDGNAPRPSNSNIKDKIDKLLNE